MQKIVAPTTCPSCGSCLTQINDQLYCTSSQCDTKILKSIEHFAKTLKIKGLGLASIEKLKITTIPRVYELSKDEIVESLGFKLGVKLFEEIERSKSASLEQLLPAFGIPLVGKTASAKLCSVINNIDEVTEQTCAEAGLGPKVTSNLITWIETEFNPYFRSGLEFSFAVEKDKKQSVDSKGIVCISGKLSTYKTKEAAKAALEALGYVVKDSLTKDVTILVNESGIESTKTKKARESGVNIVTNLNELIEE